MPQQSPQKTTQIEVIYLKKLPSSELYKRGLYFCKQNPIWEFQHLKKGSDKDSIFCLRCLQGESKKLTNSKTPHKYLF